MSGYEGETQRLQLPCPHCGGTGFSWGRVLGKLHVQRDAAGVGAWLAGSLIAVQIRVRICETCGHLQLFLPDL